MIPPPTTGVQEETKMEGREGGGGKTLGSAWGKLWTAQVKITSSCKGHGEMTQNEAICTLHERKNQDDSLRRRSRIGSRNAP